MSKNMTRKGLAFGAGLALISTGLVAAPAAAVVDDNAVSLVPLAGTDYKVDLGNSFDLKSDQSLAAVNGAGKLKFLVTDPDKEVLFDFDADGATDNDTLATSDINGGNADVTIAITKGADNAADVDTFVFANADDDNELTGLEVGDLVTFANFGTTADGAPDLTPLNGKTGTVTAVTDGDGDGNATSVTITALTTIDADAVAESVTAGDIAEKSLSDALDTVANIKLGALGVGGDPGITAPTREADGSFVINTNTDSAATTQELRLVSTSTDAHTVTVTAWIDENGNGKIDGTEDSSSTRTVTFVKLTDTGMALNFTSPTALGTAYKATISFNSDINVAQLTTTRFTVGLGRVNPSGSVANGTATAFSTGDATSYDSTNDVLTIGANGVSHTYGAIANLAANGAAADTVAFDAASEEYVINDTNDGSAFAVYVVGDTVKSTGTVTAGNAADIPNGSYKVTAVSGATLELASGIDLAAAAATATTAGALVVETFTPGVTYAAQIVADGTAQGTPTYKTVGAASADAVGKAVPTRSENVRLDAGNDWDARSLYTGDVTFTSAITKAGVAVGAGVAATVKVTRNTLDADSTVTAGGKTLTSTTADGYIEFAATTNADGKVVFTLSNDQGKAGDKVTVTVTSDGIASTGQTLTWTDLVAANAVLTVNGNEAAGNKSTARVTIEKGGSVTLNFEARDEFGKLLSGDYRVFVDLKSKKVGGAASNVAVDLSNGTGSYTFTDASAALGSYTVEGTLQKLDANLVYQNHGSPEEADTVVTVVASAAASAVSITKTVDTDAGDYPAIETVAGVAVDARLDANQAANDAPSYDADEEYTISGLVTAAGGVALPGAQVTLSGTGLLFKVGNLYTIGSVTVTANAAGQYSGVEVRSNTSGNTTLTVASGAASNTSTLTFDAPATTAGATLDVAVPAYVEAGSTFSAVGTLTDKFGNAVDTGAVMKATYTGPGITIPAALPNETDADGNIKFSVLLGSKDSGTMTVTMSYDQNADGDYTDAKDLVVTKTVTIGTAPAADTKVNAGSFKGYVAVYAKGYEGKRLSAKIGKDWVVVESLASNFERVVDFTGAGYTISVRIYIDRVLMDTIVVTTK